MIRRLIRQDLAWAGFILILAAAFGLGQQWRLVRLSWTGGLPAYLEQQRDQRRSTEFQGVPTLSLVQAYEIFQQGQALFIDARKVEEYAELHIPGAVNLSPWDPKEQGARPLAGIPTERQLVVYCGQISCDAALKVAENLQALGFSRVTVFLGGFKAWDEAGYPADTSK
jgi:rhodanese-related sulfurtransferase